MTLYTLEFKQTIPKSIEEVWEYFSLPNNLSEITPSWLNFKVLDSNLPKIYPGMYIKYHVAPIFGLQQLWVTEITQVQEGRFFIDDQRIGPYRIWHHQHFFKTVPNGTEMLDKIDYKIGYGILDSIINRIIVKPKILSIFEYRRAVISKKFPDSAVAP